MLQASGFTDKGPVRPTNEDCFAIDDAHRLCMIADGMGGHQAGAIAARMAVDVVLDVVRDRQRAGWPFGFDPRQSEAGNVVRTAIQLANMQVLEAARGSKAYAGMGTTIVAVLVADDRLSVGHVGDSRLYLLTRGRLRQLTDDDSWIAGALAADRHASALALRDHPMRHVLTAAVGLQPRTEVHVVEERLTAGDLLLLTTDGVHGVLDDRHLEGLLLEADDLAGAAAVIVRAALARGSRDNCTAIVARYVGDSPP